MVRKLGRFTVVPVSVIAAACSAEPGPPAAAPVETPAARTTLPLVPNACPELPPPRAVDEPRPYGADRNGEWRKADPKDTCAVADANVAQAAEAVLAAPRRKPNEEAVQAWDKKKAPARLAEVTRRFALGKAEQALLEKNGFVVPARLAFPSYTAAFHEIYQSEMPLYVSVDSVLHAVFRGNDSIAAEIEQRRLAPLLDRTLTAMHCALPAAAAGYPAETARDLDVYLTVARSLLADAAVPAVFEGDAPLAAKLVAAARDAKAMDRVDLFGRERFVDFTQYTPRGHYATREPLIPYFRAAMWLSRLEWNLVSRSSRSSAATDFADPNETPREAVGALALADLAQRSGGIEGVRAMERAFATFAGKREDVSLDQLAELRARAGIQSLTEARVFERFKEALGEGFQRTTKLHYMPQGTAALPAIMTMIGPRVVADSAATQPMIEPRTAHRHVVGMAEMGYALGQDRGRAYLKGEIDRFPELAARIEEARSVARAPSAGEDLYGLWYRAILGLADRPQGALPSFMSGEAYADLRLNSTVAAFGQIRHNAVLFAGQAYDQGGCQIPDAYVEPAPAVYDALIAYAERGAAALGVIDPRDESHTKAYFTSLARTLRVLSAISRDELSGKALSDDERRFLAMIMEMLPGSSGGPPTYTGWYFDLFPSVDDALGRADFVADYFTSGYEGVVSYAGASAPRMGIFVVDAGGAPRVVVGPVARGYEVHGPLAKRLDDEAASKLAKVDDPWNASFTAPAPEEPALTLTLDQDPKTSALIAVVAAKRAVPGVTVELLDHHRRPLQSLTRAVPKGKAQFRFKKLRDDQPAEVIHLAAGGAHVWREITWVEMSVELGKKGD